MRTAISTAAIAISVIGPLLACSLVGLRTYFQRLRNNHVFLDGYFLLAAAVFVTALGGLTTYGAVDGGIGWDISALDEAAMERLRKIFLVHMILWSITMVTVRVGLLLFFRRIFTTPKFRRVTSILIGINALWWISFIVVVIFLEAWNSDGRPSSRDYRVWHIIFFIAHSAIELPLDLATLVMPIFVIKGLNMTWPKKLGLMCIFSLGIFCIAAASRRLHQLVSLRDALESGDMRSNAPSLVCMWSLIEPCTSIVSACLPSLGNLKLCMCTGRQKSSPAWPGRMDSTTNLAPKGIDQGSEVPAMAALQPPRFKRVERTSSGMALEFSFARSIDYTLEKAQSNGTAMDGKRNSCLFRPVEEGDAWMTKGNL